MIGPPTAAPYWLRLSGGFGSTTRLPPTTVLRTKKLRASNASSRRYSNAVPWNEFVPDLVDTETTPAPRPNSAEKTPVSTLNSRTCSTDGEMITVLNEYLVVVDAVDEPGIGVRLMPEGVEVRRASRVERARTRQVLASLSRRDARASGRRAWRNCGRSTAVRLMARSSMTVPTSDESARTSGADDTTVIVSSMRPTSSVTSTRARWLTCRMMPSRIDFLKPCTLTSTAYVPGTRKDAV